MRTLLIAVSSILWSVTLGSHVSASNVAADTAGDSAYNSGWTTGSNGGYGWGGGWSIYPDYPLVPFVGTAADSTLGGIMNSPAVPGGRAWAIINADARRPLGGPLAAGQTISIQLDGAGIGFHDAKTDYDFGLVSHGTRDFMLGEAVPIKGGFTSYIDTGIPVINEPIAVSLTMQNEGSFTFDIRSLASPAMGGSYSFQFPSDPDQIGLGGGNDTAIAYANNLSVTPEPSAFLLISVAVIGLLWRRRQFPKNV